MRRMKRILKIAGMVLLAILISAGIFIGVLTAAEYRPDETETVIANHPVKAVLRTGEQYSVVSWSCGYGMLGDNADFFMEGGTSAFTADQDRVRENLNGILETLRAEKANFILLQEVDVNSDRSGHTDERAVLKQAMPEGTGAFAYDSRTLYIPYPLPPIGHTESGLYTLSRAEIRKAERTALPCPFPWPVRTVSMKRCLLVSRIPLADTGRELVLINLQMDAYDNGAGREAQTRMLTDLLWNEYGRGNYVIAGGNFSQEFSGVETPYRMEDSPGQPGRIDARDFEPYFQMLMDTSAATRRSLNRAYAGADPERFFCYMTDGFIVSANVRADGIRTIDTGFQYSSHNPVRLTFTLLPEGEPAADDV